MEKAISVQTLQRMPMYLNYLNALPASVGPYISAKAVSEALGLGEIQVRKDLASVSGGGKPKLGYHIETLRRDIVFFLGYDNVKDAVLVGAGRLGKALLSYAGFGNYGLNIVAAFDTSVSEPVTDVSGKQILPMSAMQGLCRRMQIKIGILTVPAGAAQEACDALVSSGVLAIWNFAPAHLSVPLGVMVRSENMAASLALLSKHLASRMEAGPSLD